MKDINRRVELGPQPLTHDDIESIIRWARSRPEPPLDNFGREALDVPFTPPAQERWERFAAAALQGLLANPDLAQDEFGNWAKQAAEFADALEAEHAKRFSALPQPAPAGAGPAPSPLPGAASPPRAAAPRPR